MAASASSLFQPTLPARGATVLDNADGIGYELFQPTLPARGATRATERRTRLGQYFNPRSPHGERHRRLPAFRRSGTISTHAPRTGSDPPGKPMRPARGISTHAPRTGSDAPASWSVRRNSYFNPRSPHGERRQRNPWPPVLRRYFNPRSPHGERHRLSVRHCRSQELISTHAPRTGSDGNRTVDFSGLTEFQPTLPARGATAIGMMPGTAVRFQPTLPARGATRSTRTTCCLSRNFNPRSPHGERRHDGTDKRLMDISTHAPRTGSDAVKQWTDLGAGYFNPRSPHGERPNAPKFGKHRQLISTHAPRTGSDGNQVLCQYDSAGFQPTLPARGATQLPLIDTPVIPISTHAPRTGSDVPSSIAFFKPHLISTHAPRTGSDRRLRKRCCLSKNISTHAPRTGSDERERTKGVIQELHFNPRSPHGERPRPLRGRTALLHISTHAPRTGSDKRTLLSFSRSRYFNPRSPHGERRASTSTPFASLKHFNPRSPHGERRRR